MSFGCVLYILGWSQPLHCSQKSIWITNHCLALHLRKQSHKHDNPIKDVYNWHRCITQHKEPNFVPVYNLCCMLYDKQLHTSIEDLLCRDSSMNWLYGEKKQKTNRILLQLHVHSCHLFWTGPQQRNQLQIRKGTFPPSLSFCSR